MAGKLGKTPARPDAVTFKFAAYATSALPKPPKAFGHADVEKTGAWGMFGNDQFGDCVWAGAAYETMAWIGAAGRRIPKFTETSVLSDYSAATGFRRSDPNSDQGTDMAKAASYRRKTGVLDGVGSRHIVSAYLALHGTTELATAAYLFGAVGVGLEFPESAMDQFDEGKPWTVVKGAETVGGHYVPLLGRNEAGNFLVVTWGKVQEVAPTFLTKYVDEAIVYLSSEQLNGTKTPEGFDAATLTADLAKI